MNCKLIRYFDNSGGGRFKKKRDKATAGGKKDRHNIKAFTHSGGKVSLSKRTQSAQGRARKGVGRVADCMEATIRTSHRTQSVNCRPLPKTKTKKCEKSRAN